MENVVQDLYTIEVLRDNDLWRKGIAKMTRLHFWVIVFFLFFTLSNSVMKP